jgi:YD repeat-containing protein
MTSNGRLRMTTDAAGFNKYFVYDKVGRLVGEVNHRGDLTEYRYDANDRLSRGDALHERRHRGESHDARQSRFDDRDVGPPSRHRLGHLHLATYDKEGRVTATMDGTIRTYEYDKSGRLVKTVAYYEPPRAGNPASVGFQTNPPTAVVSRPRTPATASPATSTTRPAASSRSSTAKAISPATIYDRAGQLVEKIAYLNATAAAYRASGTLNQLLATSRATPTTAACASSMTARGSCATRSTASTRSWNLAMTPPAAGLRRPLCRQPRRDGDYTYDNVKALVATSALVGERRRPARAGPSTTAGPPRLCDRPGGRRHPFSYDNRARS